MSKELLGLMKSEIDKLTEDHVKSHTETIMELGQKLETLHIVDTNKICAKLKRDLKGYIDSGLIQKVCKPEWKQIKGESG